MPYFALGVVAKKGLGLTPLIFVATGLLFVITIFTYFEGSAMLRERGGSSSFARHAFNELIAFVAGCGFAALGLCFTALVPTIDHMNLPVFLLVLPLAFVSGTYFPLAHPGLRPFAAVNPLYHLAETYRGLLLGGAAAGHLAALAALVALLLAVLVPLDMRLLRRRILGD